MIHPIKRVAAIHDLSCFGRCSLTVIMPILSCLGIQVCPVPTAVLSTHFGGFSKVAFQDLTDHIPEILRHWQQENITFDSIYTGFLAAPKQIDLVLQMIDRSSEQQPVVLVDPVMGDNGRLYSVYDEFMLKQMRRLIAKAAVITPNYTEACFLLEKEYQTSVDDPETLTSWLKELAAMGPKQVVITGIPLADQQIMNLGYDQQTRSVWPLITERVPVSYPGTGDAFAATLLGGLLNGQDLPAALQTATKFIMRGVQYTFAAQTPTREGILLEAVLQDLKIE